MIIIKKLLVFLCFLFVFNTLEVDSNSDIISYYDDSNIYNQDVYTLYFDNVKSKDLDLLMNSYNIEVLSYYIDENTYYARNISELDDKYLKDKSLSEKIYYDNYGYNIDGIKVLCSVGDIINLKKKIHIY